MFCPRCGKEQVLENTKFCTLCGFDLIIVTETLKNEGLLPQLIEMRLVEHKTANRMRILFSLSCWLVLSFLLNLISSIAGGSINEIIIASAGFAFGLIIMSISAPYLKSLANNKTDGVFLDLQSESAKVTANIQEKSLLSKQNLPLPDYVSPSVFRKTPTTDKLAQISSVIEDSTKLLIQDK